MTSRYLLVEWTSGPEDKRVLAHLEGVADDLMGWMCEHVQDATIGMGPGHEAQVAS